ncbi:MAG: polysaccharide deacetylase family protein [Elusimicrobiales bacterium]|jgi:peptidoglycan/xylan/chitin deacetylase (PgdA/CDA1 family)
MNFKTFKSCKKYFPVFLLVAGCFSPLAVRCFAANPYAGKFYAEGSVSKREFALTYDDGPGFITGDLLKLLDKYGAKASFFVTGYSVRKYPALAAAEHAAGHLTGNHTDKHEFYPKIGKGADRERILEKELDGGAAAIWKAAGVRPVFMRMPNGYDRDWVRKVAAARGYTLVNWTYGSDWTNIPEEKMTGEYLRNLKPGAILLMHDGGGKTREKTLRITEAVLKEARRKGLKPVTLDVLLGIPAQDGKQ